MTAACYKEILYEKSIQIWYVFPREFNKPADRNCQKHYICPLHSRYGLFSLRLLGLTRNAIYLTTLPPITPLSFSAVITWHRSLLRMQNKSRYYAFGVILSYLIGDINIGKNKLSNEFFRNESPLPSVKAVRAFCKFRVLCINWRFCCDDLSVPKFVILLFATAIFRQFLPFWRCSLMSLYSK